MVEFAIDHDYLEKDPFLLYKAKSVKKEVVFLMVDELKNLEKQNFAIKRQKTLKTFSMPILPKAKKIIK